MRILSSSQAVADAVRAFRKRVEEAAAEEAMLEWGFPNGERVTYPTYTLNSRDGQIQLGLPASWQSTVPHLIRFVKNQGPPSPDVEINIPQELDRNVAGAYASSESDLWLCHRGIFTAFRGRIPKDRAMEHFSNWLYEVEDGGRISRVVPVAAVGSPTFSDEIATFTRRVVRLKELHKQFPAGGPADYFGTRSSWFRGKEFEGAKSGLRSAAAFSYEYLHGPICNRLEEALQAVVHGRPLKFGRNGHVDAALVNAEDVAEVLFEVKTAALPSSQIYSAVGQLSYYRHLYGTPEATLLVVLPNACRCSETERFLAAIGIGLLYDSYEGFVDPSGAPLVAVMSGAAGMM